jgi:2-polyprenyl-6-methoxyphenol hydroxylase-like FAD-dependent oxidoreductase
MIVYSRARPGHVVWQLFAGGWPEARVGELASVAHMSGDLSDATTPAACLARALTTVVDWPAELRDIVAGADPATVAEHPLLFRRPADCAVWAVGAAALLGDAAHLSTPMLGQGTSAAFEDALALGRAVREAGGAGAAAAAAYQAARVDRAAAVHGLSVALFERQAGESVDEIGEHLGAGFMEAGFEALVG